MDLSGYAIVDYKEFQRELNKRFVDFGSNEMMAAAKVGIKTTLTIRKCFDKKKQIVSDTLLTKFMKVIKMDSVLVWHEGIRLYYIKSSK